MRQKHRIRTTNEHEFWAAYNRLKAELEKLGKKIVRLKVDIAYGGYAGVYTHAIIWSDEGR